MEKGMLNNSIQNIKSFDIDDYKNEFVNISLRPGVKIAAMLDVFMKLTNKKISELLTDSISNELCDYVLNNREHSESIKKVYLKLIENEEFPDEETSIEKTDCLGQLRHKGVVKITCEDFLFMIKLPKRIRR